MNVRIQTQGFSLTPAIGAHVHKQMQATLLRYAGEVMSADVFLKDLNGPRGGHDKQAIVRLQLRRNGSFAVSTTHEDLYKAIDLSARRAHRTVRKTVNRKQHIERSYTQISIRSLIG